MTMAHSTSFTHGAQACALAMTSCLGEPNCPGLQISHTGPAQPLWQQPPTPRRRPCANPQLPAEALRRPFGRSTACKVGLSGRGLVRLALAGLRTLAMLRGLTGLLGSWVPMEKHLAASARTLLVVARETKIANHPVLAG